MTVSVKVTGWPKTDGLADDVRVLVVAALFTTCVTTADVLVVKFAFPRYTAVIGCEPTARIEVVNVALPSMKRTPRLVAPSKN